MPHTRLSRGRVLLANRLGDRGELAGELAHDVELILISKLGEPERLEDLVELMPTLLEP